MNKFDKNYWQNRYIEKETAWNVGSISTPLKTYIDQLKNKELKILIPGAGNAYEAEYLWNQGFKNVYVLDIAEAPLNNLSNRVPNFPKKQLVNADFFAFEDKFDLILEQTFFCALQPSLRERYVDKMHQLLNLQGKLAGLLFQFELTESGPPFGGSKKEYVNLFKEQFEIKVLETAYNSIKVRINKELFFIFEKKM
ncbi:methyltransferase domain-containing protein [Winogradskyella ursingii]|uniref:methyltransferase domain-containing protein n=1 Tax=Winogradskyella ursingii TaxID=2686079 RepID=UPI0015C6C1E8|nr:methyltransferase domain-containing protein [Winogradskyella ursingii]